MPCDVGQHGVDLIVLKQRASFFLEGHEPIFRSRINPALCFGTSYIGIKENGVTLSHTSISNMGWYIPASAARNALASMCLLSHHAGSCLAASRISITSASFHAKMPRRLRMSLVSVCLSMVLTPVVA